MDVAYHYRLIACPHCRRKVRLSQKSETVVENGETTAKFGDCRTFLRQCGQAITDHNATGLNSAESITVLESNVHLSCFRKKCSLQH